MNNFFNLISLRVKQNKGFFILILLLTTISIILAVVAGINFSEGLFSIDLSNICYIEYLKGDCGWGALFFKLIFSLIIFILLIALFACKPYLLPISVVFYLYLIYSQILVVVSLIITYGILNCVILILLLIIYNIILTSIFLLMLLDLNMHCKNKNYFNSCFNINLSIFPICLLFILILCFIFSIILLILKSFVLILIF